MDDLDTPRVIAGVDAHILDTLRAFGLVWDGDVMYQSTRGVAYAEALRELYRRGHVFDCACSRREAQSGAVGIEGPIYPGTCRNGIPSGREPRSVRIRVNANPVTLEDGIQGRYTQYLTRDVGDFVLRRADGITAYQLATVVDDAYQGVTEIVRGADLLSSTPRQIFIGRCLATGAIDYAHVPIIVDALGAKLGKSQGAAALSARNIPAQLWRCLMLLGQAPSDSLRDTTPSRLLRWAVDNWDCGAVPRQAAISLDGTVL